MYALHYSNVQKAESQCDPTDVSDKAVEASIVDMPFHIHVALELVKTATKL